jgi:hypothetical protein
MDNLAISVLAESREVILLTKDPFPQNFANIWQANSIIFLTASLDTPPPPHTTFLV